MMQTKKAKRIQTVNDALTQVEREFIEFMSEKRKKPLPEIRDLYLATREEFRFGTAGYRELVDSIHRLCRLRYDDADQREVIDSYRFHELIHLFRFLSYAAPTPKSSFASSLGLAVRLVLRGNYEDVGKALLQKLKKSRENGAGNGGYAATAARLLELVDGKPAVVDYGCGVGYLSYELAKLRRETQIYLVDIDSLILEFARFRFRKLAVPVKVIRITKENLYPDLPAHSICIATEVLEHVFDPLKAFTKIRKHLLRGGIWYGDFADRRQEMFHISADLQAVRAESQRYFQRVSEGIYRKVA